MGGKGDDSLAGGAGSDLLKLDWSSINYKIDGGSNTDTVSFSSSSNATLSGSSFSSLLSNVEYLDFSNTTNTVSVSLGGADIQNILTGSSSLSSNAGVLDLKFEAGDSFTISASSGYSYYTAASGGTLISAGTTYNASSMSSSATHIYVFNSAGTTLLADVFFHL